MGHIRPEKLRLSEKKATMMSSERPAFIKRMATEVRTTPLQVAFAGLSAMVGSLSLYVAWRTGGPSFAAPSVAVSASEAVNGYLVSFAALATISATAALLARMTRRISWIASYFGSVIYASAASFLITLVIRTQGVRFGAPSDQPSATLWVVLWAIVVTFAAFNGQRLLRDIIDYESKPSRPGDQPNTTVGEIAFSVAIVAGFWIYFVKLGSTALASGLI